MKFSLVIPLAPDRDAPIISSLKEVDYPKSEFHVIVVRGKNPSENRNRGAERSKGEIIGFLDDDAIVDKDILKNAEKFFIENPEVDIVGGPQLTPNDDNDFAKKSGYALSSKFGAWKLAKRYSKGKESSDVDECSLTSANLFVRRKVLEKIKFDSKLFPGEDPKFIEDSKKNNFKAGYSPEIIIYHKRRNNLRSLIKQIFSYGKTRPKKESFFQTAKNPFFFIPSLFLIYLVLLAINFLFLPTTITGAVIGRSGDSVNKILLYPLFAYTLLCIGFGIYDSLRNKDYKAILLIPFIYPLVHLSYGAGMIWGYFKK